MVIHRDIAIDGIHALANADLGRKVHHAVDALQRPGNRCAIADITDLQFRVGIEPFPCGLPTMDLLDQAIQDADPMSVGEQRAGEVASDETRAASNENTFRQLVASVRRLCRPLTIAATLGSSNRWFLTEAGRAGVPGRRLWCPTKGRTRPAPIRGRGRIGNHPDLLRSEFIR